ncbi:hypothetical protein ASG88_17710 [Nocardioides sp. Soil777]|nr:hypothetical protein ASG88_17710 [Nocardioides sp. Soil777]
MGSTFDHNWRQSGWVDLLQGEGCEVLPFLLPGHGGSPALSGPTDSAQRRLLMAVDALKGPVDVVGFSAGAVATLAAVIERPHLFRRAVLLGIGDAMLDRRTVGVTFLADALDEPAENPPASTLVRLIRQMVRVAGNDLSEVAAYARAMPPPPTWLQIANIDVPMLVGVGDRDEVGPADRLASTLPCGRLVTLRGVDHFTTTSSFASQDAVLRFLADVTPGAEPAASGTLTC